MKKALVLIAVSAMLIGCTRYVKGTKLDIGIKRAPLGGHARTIQYWTANTSVCGEGAKVIVKLCAFETHKTDA